LNDLGPLALRITPSSILARWRQPSNKPEGATESAKILGEVAALDPDATLRRLSSNPSGLTTDQVEERLRSVGHNQITHQARHTILSELVGRSINPLNVLLLSLATASHFRRSTGGDRNRRYGGPQHLAGLHPGTSIQQCCRQAAKDGVSQRNRASTGRYCGA
jgi:cation transport ATPase-like protein